MGIADSRSHDKKEVLAMKAAIIAGCAALLLATSAYTLYQIKVAHDVEKFAEDFCHYVISCEENKK
jgi:hypothetical protein